MKTGFFSLSLLALLLMVGTRSSQSREMPSGRESQETTESTQQAAQEYFPDVVLVNQDGEQMRFYSDLLKGKTVVIKAFFTTNTTTDPPMEANLARIQDRLGSHLGTDVYLISISVDPVTDTPEKLKRYAGLFKAKPGWFFLTGKKENVDTVLRKLGLYTGDRESHPILLLIGNDNTGLWKKANGLAKVEDLIPIIESVLKDQD